MFRLIFFTGGMLILGFIVFLISEYLSRRETINKHRLRSVVVTYDLGAPYFVGPADLANLTALVNEKLLAPYGESDSWLNKPIHTKDIVSIVSLPQQSIDKVQIVVWYLHRYQNVIEPKPTYNNFNPYRNTWLK